MRKVICCIVLVLFTASICFAALTTAEKTILREIYHYYSGNIPGLPYNEAIQTTISEGTEAERKTIIKDYLVNIVIPDMDASLVTLQADHDSITTRRNQYQNWVNAN